MGYRGNPDWRDMSDYVVHFTKDTGDTIAYDAQIGILASQRVEARSAFGGATNLEQLGDSQQAACFSEIPLDMLDRLVARRSRYGIGFHQGFVTAAGGGRVWYLDPGTPQREALREVVRRAMVGGVDPDDPVWMLTPYVDYTADNYHFEWEREWLVAGDLSFTSKDVAFLFVPEERHEAARAFLADGGGNTGPAYACPLLDPLWGDERIQDALAGVA